MPANTSQKSRSRKAAIEILQQIDLFSPWKYVKNPDLQMLENNSKKGTRRGILDSIFASGGSGGGGWLKLASAVVGKKRVSEMITKYHNDRLNRRNNNLSSNKQNAAPASAASSDATAKVLVPGGDDDETELTLFETSRYIALDVTRNVWFESLVMIVIIVNSVLISFNFERSGYEMTSWYLELFFTSVYTTEALLKVSIWREQCEICIYIYVYVYIYMLDLWRSMGLLFKQL